MGPRPPPIRAVDGMNPANPGVPASRCQRHQAPQRVVVTGLIIIEGGFQQGDDLFVLELIDKRRSEIVMGIANTITIFAAAGQTQALFEIGRSSSIITEVSVIQSEIEGRCIVRRFRPDRIGNQQGSVRMLPKLTIAERFSQSEPSDAVLAETSIASWTARPS